MKLKWEKCIQAETGLVHNELHLNIYKFLLMLIESCYADKVVSVSPKDAIVLRESDRDTVVASQFEKIGKFVYENKSFDHQLYVWY